MLPPAHPGITGGLPKRTIHLDFHTGPDIPDVGADFDADAFARSFHDAHVDAVTVFAQCHHGHLYYRTQRSARHPHLPADLDLMGEQVAALHEVGIRAPIYLSVQVNEFAANTHPEWVAVEADGRLAKRVPTEPSLEPRREPVALTAGWQVLDMASPYQEYMAEVLAEVLDRYSPVDGIFLDMCWDQVSVSRWALTEMSTAGLDARSEADRARHARTVAERYMARFSDQVEAAGSEHQHFGVWFNSRPKTRLHVEQRYLRHVEIEALPTGGWGYAYFPYVARFVRPLGLPTLSHTGRFFRSWGDNAGLKPAAALRYECCQILAQGMANGVGDLLHPRGVPHPEVYRLIGEVYEHVSRCEPFVEGAQLEADIAVVVDPDLGDEPGPAGYGVTRALQQLHHQFDLLSPDASFDGYRLVLLPETTPTDASLASRLLRFAESGGGVVLLGAAAQNGDGAPLLGPAQGIAIEGESPFTRTFLRVTGAVDSGIAPYDHVMYERGFCMRTSTGGTPLVRVVEPYFERTHHRFSGHSYTPPHEESDYSAVVRCGSVLTISVPLMAAYGLHAQPVYRELLGNCLSLLLPEPLLGIDGHRSLETTVATSSTATVVHLLSFNVERRAEGLDVVEEPLPVIDAEVRVRLAGRPASAHLQPHGIALDVDWTGSYASVRVSLLDGHGMLVFAH